MTQIPADARQLLAAPPVPPPTQQDLMIDLAAAHEYLAALHRGIAIPLHSLVGIGHAAMRRALFAEARVRELEVELTLEEIISGKALAKLRQQG